MTKMVCYVIQILQNVLDVILIMKIRQNDYNCNSYVFSIVKLSFEDFVRST